MKKIIILTLAAVLLAGCGSVSTSPAAESSDASSSNIGTYSAEIISTESSDSPNADRSMDSTETNGTDTKITDTVTFGKYQGQDISWFVLDTDGEKTLLLSAHALDAKPFSDESALWDKSSLRVWLNNDFYKEAFSTEEQDEILPSKLDNGDDLHYGTIVGQNTEALVFLLSASEAKKYLSKEETTASPTDYASSKGAYTNEEGNCAWWLRSPGMKDDGPAYYSSQGEIGTRAHAGSEGIIGIRPAIWVNTAALK